MILAIFLVGAFIFLVACKFEGKQNKKEMDDLKRSNRLVRKLLNGSNINKK